MKLAPVLALAWAAVVWADGDRYKDCPFDHEAPNSGYNIVNKRGMKTKESCRRSDHYKAESGCAYTIQCVEPKSKDVPGYYFEGDYDGDGIKIKCRPNGKWTTVDGQKPIPKCIQGCLVPSKDQMENSTFKSQPRDIYKTPYGQRLYPAGAALETQCKNGFVFTDPKFEEKGYDRHICQKSKEGSGWYDDINKNPQGWPAKCRGVCPAYSKTLPEGVEIVQNPENNPGSVKDYGNGTIVLLDKAQYKFRCKEGYKPVNPAHQNGQELNCLGGSWNDKQTGKGDAEPLKCLSEGCPDVSKFLPANAYSEVGENCGGGAAKKDGCNVAIKCKKTDGRPNGLGWFMPGKPNGIKLYCKKGTWYTEDGTPAVANDKGVYGDCSVGCVGLTSSDKVSTDIIGEIYGTGSPNGDVMVYSHASIVTTACKDNYIRPGLDNQPSNGETFKCTSTGWENVVPEQVVLNLFPNSCSPACELPNDAAGGTNYDIRGSITMKKGRKLVPKGAQLDAQCKDKFIPPAGMPRFQVLVCEGGNLGWMSKATNKTNENVLRCERDGAAGCTLVQNTTTTETHYIGDCTPTEDNLLPPNCKIVVKCKPGFFPEGSVEVDGSTGEQSLECKAGNDGYVNINNGKKNVAALKCSQACEFYDTVQGAIYVQKPQESDFIGTYAGKKFVKTGTKTTMRCPAIDSGYYYNNDYDLDRARRGIYNVDYTCVGGNSKYAKDISGALNRMPGDMCGPICNAIEPIATHKIENTGREDSIMFTHEGIKRAVNVEYHITCQRGYEFPPGSKEASAGIQKLLCVGGSEGYMDLSNNANQSKVAPCTKIADPRCPPIDLTNSQVEISSSYGKCNPASGQYDQGCEISLKCADGSFPSEFYQGSSATQKITCKILANNTAVWVQGNNGEGIVPLKCEKGCAAIKEKSSFMLTNAPKAVQSGGVSYYRKGELVSVRCNPGYIPRFETELNPKDGEEGIHYVCLATDPTMPWQNTKNMKLDKGPDTVCVKTCPALYADKEGVYIDYGPHEKPSDTGNIVSGGGIYTMKCRQNYHYKDVKLREKNEQLLYCDPDNGFYVDLTDGNQTRASMAPCVLIGSEVCRDLPVSNGKTDSTCTDGNKKGCKVTVKCNEGYIPEDKNYHQTGIQQLQCPEGSEWVDSNGNVVHEAMKCVPACKYTKSQITNAKVDQVSTTIITVNNTDYVLGGTALKVTCTGDGVIWMENIQETTTSHDYQCSGGSAGYKRAGYNKVNITLGDGCVGTCVARNDLISAGDTVIFKQQPRKYIYNGQTLAVGGDVYGFECMPDYVYANGDGSEWFRCNPKTRQFESSAGMPLVKPTQCVRNPRNDECKKFDIDNATTNADTDGCYLSDSVTKEYYLQNCSIRLTCKSGYMPTNEKYHDVTGVQRLICGVGGPGWADQNGTVVEGPMKCVEGCVEAPTKDIDLLFKEYGHDLVNGKRLTSTCYEPRKHQNGTALIVSNIYACLPKNPEEYFKKVCVGACRKIPRSMLREVRLIKDAIELSTTSEFVYAETEYQIGCKPGYEYPPGSPHAASAMQILKCINETGNYQDSTTLQHNATIAKCVPKTGCKNMAKGQGVVETCLTMCPTNVDSSRDQTTLEYTCGNGYYPADEKILFEGSVKVRCDGSKQAWYETKSNEEGKAPVCLSGCSQLGYETVAKYFEATKQSVTTQPIVDSNGGQHICYTSVTFQEIKKQIQEVQKHNSPYFCKTKNPINNSEIIVDTNNGCPKTCIALNTGFMPAGVQIKSKPGEFEAHGNKYVATGDYVFQCQAGFQYEAGTPEAQRNEHRVTCLDNGNLVDANRNPVKEIKPCRQVPGCENLVSSPSVTYTPGPNCGSSNGVLSGGCEVTAKCPAGSYPTDTDHQRKDSVTYKCHINSVNQPVWTDKATGIQAVNMLKCTPGCLPISNIITGSKSEQFSFGNKSSCSKVDDSVLQQLPDAAKQYICELNNGGDPATASITCSGMCTIPKPDQSITLRQSTEGQNVIQVVQLMIDNPFNKPIPLSKQFLTSLLGLVYEYPNQVLSAECPSGLRFEDTQTSQRSLRCDPETFKFMENGQIVSKIGRCV